MKIKVKTGDVTMTTTEELMEVTTRCFAGAPGMTEECEMKLTAMKDCTGVELVAMLEPPVSIVIKESQFIQFAALVAEFKK